MRAIVSRMSRTISSAVFHSWAVIWPVLSLIAPVVGIPQSQSSFQAIQPSIEPIVSFIQVRELEFSGRHPYIKT